MKNPLVMGIAACAVVAGGLLLSSCGGGACAVPNPNYDASDPSSPVCLDGPGPGGNPAAALTVVGASYTLPSSTTVDNSVQITSSDSPDNGSGNGSGSGGGGGGGGGAGSIMEVQPGSNVKIIVPFSAPNGNVTGVGIRFGDSGPIQVVDIPGASGQTGGVMEADVEIPDSVCNNLSQICHDIKCYEFAVTDAGNISAADINSIALKCGNCDEPSCQDLLTSCEGECASDSDCSTGEACIDGVCVGAGDLRFTLTWTGQSDADLYVNTPGGNEIFYGNSSADGGQLDKDCVDPPSCSPVENVFFTNPAPGTYSARVNNLGSNQVNFTLTVATPNGQLASDSGSLGGGETSSSISVNYSP